MVIYLFETFFISEPKKGFQNLKQNILKKLPMWRKKFALNSFLRKYNNIEAKIESIYAFLQY